MQIIPVIIPTISKEPKNLIYVRKSKDIHPDGNKKGNLCGVYVCH